LEDLDENAPDAGNLGGLARGGNFDGTAEANRHTANAERIEESLLLAGRRPNRSLGMPRARMNSV